MSPDQHKLRRRYLSGEVPAFGTVLVALCIDTFGTAALNWEPEILVEGLRETYKTDIPDDVRDRLFALITVLTSDMVYTDPLVFNHVANALSGGDVPMTTFEPAEPVEAAWAVVEVLMADNDDIDPEAFGEDVKAFIGTILWDAGLPAFPPLDFVEKYVSMQGFGETTAPGMIQAEVLEREQEMREIKTEVAEGITRLREQLASLRVGNDAAPRQTSPQR